MYFVTPPCLLVILISILQFSSSAYDCENVIRNPDSCQLSEVSEELYLGDKYVGLEYVAAILPSTVAINRYLYQIFLEVKTIFGCDCRCSGHCSTRYNSQCEGIETIIRYENSLHRLIMSFSYQN